MIPPAVVILRVDGGVDCRPAPAVVRLDTLRDLIGCAYVDVVRLTSRLDMWIDDEGVYTQPPNPVATALAQRYGRTWQSYHGTVVLAAFNEDGDTIGLTPAQVRGVLITLRDIAA